MHVHRIFNAYSMNVQSPFDGRSTSSAGRWARARGVSGGIEMDDKVNEIIERLPAKPPRSRLDPHAALIEEMRRRGRTFMEIARVLAEECQVSSSPSNIHHFLKLRTRTAKAERRPSVRPGVSSESRIPADECGQEGVAANTANRCCAENRGTQTAKALSATDLGRIRLRSQ